MRILIVDDHALFRESLRFLLTERGDVVVGEARTGEEALSLAERLRPDVVLMDLCMPGMGGLAATRSLCAQPNPPKVVVLTGLDDDDAVFETLRAGAIGYLLKGLEAETFFELLDGVARDEPALPPAITRKVLDEITRPRGSKKDPLELTPREREVVEKMVDGVTSNFKLARSLAVSENTVKFHIRHILEKLDLHDRAQVVGHVLLHGGLDRSRDRD